MTYKELETARLLNKILHVDIYVGTNFIGVDFVMVQTSTSGSVAREPLHDTRYKLKYFKSQASLLKFLQWFDRLPLHSEFQNHDKLEYPYRLRFTTHT